MEVYSWENNRTKYGFIGMFDHRRVPIISNNMIVFVVFQCRDLHNRDKCLGANKRSDLNNPTVCALGHLYVQ